MSNGAIRPGRKVVDLEKNLDVKSDNKTPLGVKNREEKSFSETAKILPIYAKLSTLTLPIKFVIVVTVVKEI